MREVVIQSWCDECAAEGNDVAGSPIDMVWQGRDYSLDLCEDHAVPLREVQRLIDTYGHANKRAKAAKERSPRESAATTAARQADGTYQCSQCGRAFATPQGLGAHRYRSRDHLTA